MNRIQNLIAQDKVDDALSQLLDDASPDDNATLIVLSSRWKSLKSQHIQNTISASDYSVSKSQIVRAILALSGNGVSTTTNAIPEKSTISTTLNDLISKYKRRNTSIAIKAADILDEYTKYKNQNISTPGFDASGRRYRLIEESVNNLLQLVDEDSMDDLEDFVTSVQLNIEATVPDYGSLKHAYDLCSGRGFEDKWVETQLVSQPMDNEVNISIAERIENYLTSLKR